MTGKRETADTLLHGKDKEVWNKAVSNEIGCLAQGNKYGVKATDTIEFIARAQVPNNKKVTYAQFVFDFRLHKTEQHRCCIVTGGDKLDYEEDVSSPATSMLETKILLNSTISDASKGARFISSDLDFFLASPMAKPE